MKHIMDVEIAKLIGTDASLFLENICFWIKHNYSNDINFHEGRYWTYNTQEALVDFFPYWSRDQIKRIIKKCYDAGYLLKSNFNKLSYDRTTWFSLSDIAHDHYGLNLGRNSLRHQAKSPEPLDEIAQPIPDNKPDNKPYIKDKNNAQNKNRSAAVVSSFVLPDWLPQELWEEFKQHRKDLKNPMTELAQKKSINALDKMRRDGQDIVKVIEASIANGWKGLFEIKSHGVKGNAKDCKYTDRNGKFDGTKYLIESIRSGESQKNSFSYENDISIEVSEYPWITGTN